MRTTLEQKIYHLPPEIRGLSIETLRLATELVKKNEEIYSKKQDGNAAVEEIMRRAYSHFYDNFDRRILSRRIDDYDIVLPYGQCKQVENITNFPRRVNYLTKGRMISYKGYEFLRDNLNEYIFFDHKKSIISVDRKALHNFTIANKMDIFRLHSSPKELPQVLVQVSPFYDVIDKDLPHVNGIVNPHIAMALKLNAELFALNMDATRSGVGMDMKGQESLENKLKIEASLNYVERKLDSCKRIFYYDRDAKIYIDPSCSAYKPIDKLFTTYGDTLAEGRGNFAIKLDPYNEEIKELENK